MREHRGLLLRIDYAAVLRVKDVQRDSKVKPAD
jgi:hypothetical protein